MDFTREPIIETIITPKEGFQLVIRSSKSAGQEEYFVDAVEIVSFGNAHFFRSLERPKAFLVPVLDYEILEVREARMVLKNAGLNRSIKIGGGRDAALKTSREPEREEILVDERLPEEEILQEIEPPPLVEARAEVRADKKRDRRRHYRKRRGKEEKEEVSKEEVMETPVPLPEEDKIKISVLEKEPVDAQEGAAPMPSPLLSSLLQPPTTLISETINRYRQEFKNAFYLTEEEQYKPHDKVQDLLNEDDEEAIPPLLEPTFLSEEGLEPFEQNESENLMRLDQEDDLQKESFSIEEHEKTDRVGDIFLPFLEPDSSDFVAKPQYPNAENSEEDNPPPLL